MQEAAGGDLWSVYGKSVKSVDCQNRRFTVTLNRVKVFESAITTALQQSDHAVLSRQDHNDDDNPNDDQMSSSGHVAVMLNCPLLADDKLMNRHVNTTMTQLRLLFVSQHIRALLCDNRSLSLFSARHLCLGPFPSRHVGVYSGHRKTVYDGWKGNEVITGSENVKQLCSVLAHDSIYAYCAICPSV